METKPSENTAKRVHAGGIRRVYPEISNSDLADVLRRFDTDEFHDNGRRLSRTRHLWPEFEASLGDLAPAVRSEEDFDARTFLRQAAYIRSWTASCPPEREQDLFMFASTLPLFYRYLERRLGRPVFAEGAAVTPFLLANPALSKFLRRGALFSVWSPQMAYVPGRDFHVVTIHGMDAISTRVRPVDFVTLDLSKVPERFKEIVFLYMMSTPQRVIAIHNNALVGIVVRFLGEYVSLKAEPGYPNPDLHVMTAVEMDHMRAHIFDQYSSASSRNSMLCLFKDFARWAVDRGILSAPRAYLRKLRSAKESGKGRQEVIPASHLALVMQRARELATKDTLSACRYVALRVFAVTKMRPSYLCNLREDCLRQTPDHGVWQVVAPTKTSGAGKDRITVSDAERRAIEALREVTRPLRDEARARGYGDSLFIYKGRSGVLVLNRDSLCQYLRRLCDDLGLPHYQLRHIRAARQTRAARFAEKMGFSGQDTALLTGHKKVDVTMNNYVAVSASDYYAALYGVMTEDVQSAVHGRVVDDIPAGTEPAAGDGAALGACSREDLCTARTLLPCLTCPSFVTDVHHLSLFEQAVEDIDRRIMAATVEHDREDLVNVKEIYVVFIKKIREIIWQTKAKNGK